MRFLHHHRLVLSAVGLCIVAFGCDGDNDRAMDPQGGAAPSPFGVWRLTSGSFFIEFDPYESVILVLNGNGTGHWTLRNVATSALLRVDLLHVRSGDELQVSFIGLGGGIGATYSFVLDDADTMRLVGQSSTPKGLVDGRIGLLSREPQLPDEFRLRTFDVVNRFDELERPVSINDLVTDGTVLIYQTPDVEFGAVQKIDPDTGTVLETFTSFSGAQHIQTTQDAGFWSHCGCGGSEDARLTDGTVSDVVDTADLGAEIQIRAMAFDPVGRVLWFQGTNQGAGRILKVDADAEPDVLLDSGPFDEFLAGMAWDGAELWMIVSNAVESMTILRVDATTLDVVETYRSPDTTVQWTGIVFLGERQFLLGIDPADEGVIVEVSKAS